MQLARTYLLLCLGNAGLLALLNVYHLNLGKPAARWHAGKGYSFFKKSMISEDLSAYIHPEANAVQDCSYPGSLLCLALMALTSANVDQKYCSLIIVAFWVSVCYQFLEAKYE